MILHIDMDAFYASVEQRDRPELQGLPVVVGGSASGRGVVCAASYEARRFGVHSAMPARQAQKLCPNAVFLSPRMTVYAGISKQIREVFHRYTPIVQPLSMDEAFLDVAGSGRLFGSASEIGQKIKADILNEVKLIASVGVAPNKFLAKVASDLDKPNGFCVVPEDSIQEFLDPLEVSRVWGVGKVAARKLAKLGVRTIRELRQIPEDVLVSRFGSWGRQLLRLGQGIDDRRVVPDRDAKSISHETTFRDDVTDIDTLKAWVSWLAEQVGRRLRRHEVRAGTVHLKLRDNGFRTLTRAHKLAEPSHRSREIGEVATALLDSAIESFRSSESFAFRLIGVGVSQLDHSQLSQGLLFDEQRNRREECKDRVADEIADRFGKLAIRPGSALSLPKRDRDNPYEAQ